MYDTREEAEAAQRAGEVVDFSQVKGDDGLTDEERHLKKYEDRRNADKGGASSPGSSSQTSSGATGTTEPSVKSVHQPTAPTTGQPSKPSTTGPSGAPSTAGSGTEKQ